MKMRIQITAFCIFFLGYFSLTSNCGADSYIFSNKTVVRIIVTDSGLGGLSVVADLEQKLKNKGIFKNVDLIFVNSLFSNESGYNSLPDKNEKIRIFSSALESMKNQYNPDLILIACNTLSVIYNDTPFAKNTKIPVRGIVEPGVEIIAKNIQSETDSNVIIFGTETTIKENTHKQKLVSMGKEPERLITQPCPELADYIENSPDSPETEMLISAYVNEALGKIENKKTPLFVSFNCSHYPYSLNLWEKVFQDCGVTPKGFLNPNSSMTDFILHPEYMYRFNMTRITVKVVSMVPISEKKIESIGKLLKDTQTSKALLNYELKPDLFIWN
jgi:glutamate racemase